MKSISANLTDKQWETIEKIIEPQERRRKHSLREIMNGLMYLLITDGHSNGFHPVYKRWVVERSFSWLENFRRLTTDYEYLAESSAAIVQLAFVRIMLNKII